jgi:hypothetical protein
VLVLLLRHAVDVDVGGGGAGPSDSAVPSLNEEQLETLQAAVEICPDATLEALQKIIADESKVTVSWISAGTHLRYLIP